MRLQEFEDDRALDKLQTIADYYRKYQRDGRAVLVWRTITIGPGRPRKGIRGRAARPKTITEMSAWVCRIDDVLYLCSADEGADAIGLCDPIVDNATVDWAVDRYRMWLSWQNHIRKSRRRSAIGTLHGNLIQTRAAESSPPYSDLLLRLVR